MEDEPTTRPLIGVLDKRWDGTLAKGAGVGEGDGMIFYRQRRTDIPVEHPRKDIQEEVG